MIEFALVLPILAALLVGITTAGFAFNSNVSLNNASREAARYGATLTVETSMSAFLQDVADVAIGSATGDLNNGVAGRQVCVAYVYPDGTDPADQTTRLVIDVTGTATVSVGQGCLNDGRPSHERRIQVAVQRDSDLIVVFFSTTVTLNSSSVVRYERAA